MDKNHLIKACDNWKNTDNSSLFTKLLKKKKYNIDIEKVTKEGDIIFFIDQKALGLLDQDFKKYPILKTNFFANFMGEFLVRHNINEFTKIILNIPPSEYNNIVNKFNHRNFGMFYQQTNQIFTFQFHVSLIQNILLEELEKIFDV